MGRLYTLFTCNSKEFPPALGPVERQYGRRLYWRFCTLNGISVACLMNHVLILYAIRNGLNDTTVAVMASFVYLAMPFMMLGKPMVSRIGAARTRGLGWFLRYVSASFMILGPFLAPHTTQPVVTAVIVAGAFGFAFFRSIGIAATKPLHGEITEPGQRGSFLSTNHLRVHSTYLVTMALVVSVFKYFDELWVYQLVIGTGCAVGFYASTIMVLIPESSTPRRSAQKSLKKMLGNVWTDAGSRRLLFVWCSAAASKSLVIPFLMIAVKNGYGVSDFFALGMAMVLILGGIAGGIVNRKISDAAGGRTLLIFHISGLMAVALFWGFAPPAFMMAPVAASFFITGFCDAGISIGIGCCFLNTVADGDRVGSSMIMQICSGTTAGLAGSVIGGGLLKLLSDAGIERFDIYRYYFIIILFVTALLLAVITRLFHSELSNA